MSKLPQLNLRIPTQHHELIRQIAQRLRESGGDAVAAGLSAFLEAAPVPSAPPDLPVRVAEVEGQLLVLEARLAKLEAPAPTTTKRLTPAKMVKSGLAKI